MNRLFIFPHNYVIIDIEMTGLDLNNDSIIEIAGLRVINDKIEDSFSSLIKPNESILKEEITELTGITEEMLSTAPCFPEIKNELISFIAELPIVGHNVLFDIQFLNKTLKEHDFEILDNDYVDTLPLSQKLFPEFIHHRLTDMALYYGINTDGAHRALQDCHINKDCFDKMRSTMERSFPSEKAFTESFTTTGKRLKAEYIQTLIQQSDSFIKQSTEMENTSLIHNKIFVFTGILTRMSRREAMLLVARLGGINEDKLTTKVNYLVVGEKEEEIVNHDNLSNKEKKALRYKEEGYPIQILNEEEFLEIIEKSRF